MTKEPFIAHSELTNEIYIVIGKEKYRVTEQAIKAVKAISSLEQEPTTKNDLGVDWESYKDVDGNSLDDLILEVLQNNFDCGNTYGYKVADEIIALLPSVTPQEPQSFKWCTDCKEYDQEKHCCHRYSKVIRDTVAEIRQEPKTGHWISHREHCENLGVMPSGLGAYEWCSNCDCGIDVREWHRNYYNYCPNCGRAMIEPQESEG